MLVQVESVIDILFMSDLSHPLTFSSIEFQRFDVFAINVYYDRIDYMPLVIFLIHSRCRQSWHALKTEKIFYVLLTEER